MGDIVKDLNVLEALLSKLQVAYEQFFAGGARSEPFELVRQVEEIIRVQGQARILNPTHRFRLAALTARYNSYRQVWDRRLRKMEGEAGPKAWGVVQKGKPTAPPPAAPFSTVIAEWPPRDSQMNELFERYVALRRKSNEPVDKLRLDSFSRMLSQQLEKLRERSGCSEVTIRVDIQDNKSRIVAKPRS